MEREPKSLGAFKIAERMEFYARKVKPESKDGFDSKLRDLVDPGNLSRFIVTQSRLKLLIIKNFTSYVYFSFIMKTIH